MNKMVKEKIFKGKDVYITSKFGKRTYKYNGKMITDFHNGVDYGTYGLKLPQYAIEDGVVKNVGISDGLGNYVYIEYQRINKIFLHAHLDKINVKKGQAVNNNSVIGTTGTTGQSTGVHLHLGMFNSNEWNKPFHKTKWEDAEKYIYKEPTKENSNFKVGDDIILNGQLFRDSFGNGAGAIKTNYNGKITLVNKASSKPYHIDKIGWVSANSIKKTNISSYVVKKGDTLTSIAKKYNKNFREIYNLNKDKIDEENKKRGIPINNLWIYPGQKLKIE